MSPRSLLCALTVSLLCLGLLSCKTFGSRSRYPPPPPPPPSDPGVPLTPVPSDQSAPKSEAEPLPVRRVPEPIVVAAWAEPKRLPPGGGPVQILVRIQKKGGRPYPGVEVRLATSAGTLYSGGRVLVTDKQGMTRDRLTTRQAATITLNAGGTRYRFRVPTGEEGP
jgi:hypothetical protein